MTKENSTKVINIYNQKDYDVYIGRGDSGNKHIQNTPPKERGWLGNPFTLENHSRKESIKKFKKVFLEKIEESKEFEKAVRDLKGKTLACFCKPKPCHGDVIKEYLEGERK